jgi:mRNA interferase RelE/StbE
MWSLEYSQKSVKQAKKLDKAIVKRISDYLDEVVKSEDPRSKGRALLGNWQGFWRYRIGDYRVIAEIKDLELVVIAIEVAHRRDIYQ